ncbi:uncharacterized protein [Dermacentor andersoni]|uniref:uncharacterized protein n=1 Tax=Dermacentor andersoni TaxID=34620 RepID=UPI003B3A4921
MSRNTRRRSLRASSPVRSEVQPVRDVDWRTAATTGISRRRRRELPTERRPVRSISRGSSFHAPAGHPSACLLANGRVFWQGDRIEANNGVPVFNPLLRQERPDIILQSDSNAPKPYFSLVCADTVNDTVKDVQESKPSDGRNGDTETDRNIHRVFRNPIRTVFEVADVRSFSAVTCNHVVTAVVNVFLVSTAYGKRRAASEVDRHIHQPSSIEAGATVETANACAFVATRIHPALACDDHGVIAAVDVFWMPTGCDRRRIGSDVNPDVHQSLGLGVQTTFAPADVRACVAEQAYFAHVRDHVFCTIVDASKGCDQRLYETSATERDVQLSAKIGAQIAFGTVDLDFVEVFRISACRRRRTCPACALRGVPSGRTDHSATSPATPFFLRHPGPSAVPLSRRGRRLREPREQTPCMRRREEALLRGSLAPVQQLSTGPPSAGPQRPRAAQVECWLASEEPEERRSPAVSEETTEVPVKFLTLGCLLGYTTSVAHFDSASVCFHLPDAPRVFQVSANVVIPRREMMNDAVGRQGPPGPRMAPVSSRGRRGERVLSGRNRAVRLSGRRIVGLATTHRAPGRGRSRGSHRAATADS